MDNFNLQRMGRFTRWTIVTDMPYYRKTFASYVAFMCIFLQVPNLVVAFGKDPSNSTSMPVGAVIGILVASVIMGGSYMLMSFYNRKDALRDLAMIPASNLEKFLVRYLTAFLINLLMFLIGIIIADGLQYLVGLVIQREPLGFVLADTWDILSTPTKPASASKGYFLISLAIWLHTYFLMGANLVRNIKYGWVFSALTLLVVFILFIQIVNPSDIFHDKGTIGHLINRNLALVDILLLALSALQAWLSYKLFCSRQLIGKYFTF